MEELDESSAVASRDGDTSKTRTGMMLECWLEWIGIFCVFILVEKDGFGAGDSMDIERNSVVSSDFKLTDSTENTDEGEVLMLQEDDIPGASLNGKDPSELNVVQLKRWLACRGAPLSGKKPELIDRYDCCI